MEHTHQVHVHNPCEEAVVQSYALGLDPLRVCDLTTAFNGFPKSIIYLTWEMKLYRAIYARRRIHNLPCWEITSSKKGSQNSYRGLRNLPRSCRAGSVDALLILTRRYPFFLYIHIPWKEGIPFGSFTSWWSRDPDETEIKPMKDTHRSNPPNFRNELFCAIYACWRRTRNLSC